MSRGLLGEDDPTTLVNTLVDLFGKYAERFHRKQILLKTLLNVNRFENATASVSICTPKTHRLQNDDVTVTLASTPAVIQTGG